MHSDHVSRRSKGIKALKITKRKRLELISSCVFCAILPAAFFML